MSSLKKLFTTALLIALAAAGTLLPVSPVSAASVTINVSPATGAPGTSTVVIGQGFTVAATYTVSFVLGTSVTQVASGTVVTGGLIQTPFTIPILPRGKYYVSVSTSSDITPQPLPTFTITPQIFLSASSGTTGDKINVSGNGFNPGEKLSLMFDNVNIVSPSTNAQGELPQTEITLPVVPFGSHTISAKDSAGTAPIVNINVTPKVNLSTQAATVNSVIKISGTGFAASKSVAFFVDNTQMYATSSTDIFGKFTDFSITIPALSGGTHNITAKDASGNFGQGSFSLLPSIVVNPTSGQAGTKVTITGYGFTSSADNPINLTFNDNTIPTDPSPLKADATGSFTLQFQIPSGSSGVVIITAKDKTVTTSTNFTYSAKVGVTPLTGVVGTSVTASGSGFKSNTPVTVTYDGTQVGIATSDIDGKFNITFRVPDSSSGKHQITVTDGVTPSSYDFSVQPQGKIDTTSGNVGTFISAGGSGFVAGADVTAEYDAATAATTKVNDNGTFTITFPAPASNAGVHKIVVTDGTTTLTGDFAMDSVAPAAPVPVSPKTMTKASKTPILDWQDVTDPSGITYSLQLATDATFSLVLVSQDGLTASTYTVDTKNSLASVSKDEPYYWRVRAIDGAGNQSPWSAPSTFYIGTIIPASTYVIIIIGVCILVGGIAFLIEWLRSR